MPFTYVTYNMFSMDSLENSNNNYETLINCNIWCRVPVCDINKYKVKLNVQRRVLAVISINIRQAVQCNRALLFPVSVLS